MQHTSHIRHVALPPSFQDQSSTGQSLLPPVLFPSDFPPRVYSTTDPTNYRHSSVRRPGTEAQAAPYHSPPSRTHRISSASSTSSDPGVLVSSPAPLLTANPQTPAYIVLPSPQALSQSTYGSPVSPLDSTIELSNSPESPRQFGQPVQFAEYFPQRQGGSTSAYSESPGSSVAYQPQQQQFTSPDRQLVEVPQLDMRQNVASSRASISNLLDPTGDTPRSALPGNRGSYRYDRR
ncbi:hypothetical protein V1509DRAFT_622342 [Lipomyces kononenkoae]